MTQRVRHGDRIEPAVECLALRKGSRAGFGLPDVAEAWTRPTLTGVSAGRARAGTRRLRCAAGRLQ